MIVYNYDADLEVSDTCFRSSLLSWVELSYRTKTVVVYELQFTIHELFNLLLV